MAVKHAGYTMGYVVARKTVHPVNGHEWTDDVRPVPTYGDGETLVESLGAGYEIYAMVLADMDQHFNDTVYGKRPEDVWDEACMAMGWAMDNGPVEAAPAYVAANNPYKHAEV